MGIRSFLGSILLLAFSHDGSFAYAASPTSAMELDRPCVSERSRSRGPRSQRPISTACQIIDEPGGWPTHYPFRYRLPDLGPLRVGEPRHTSANVRPFEERRTRSSTGAGPSSRRRQSSLSP
jgi:hypothetical protein